MDVAGEYYNIYGARLVPAPLSGAIRPQRWALWHDEHFQDARLIGSTGYIRAGGGGSGHILLRPGERDVENITIAVPRNRYAALHLYWTVYLGIAPINPPFKLRTQRRSDGAIVINGLYPHDDGEQMVVL